MKRESNPGEGFINESALDFTDISSERERVYTFPNGETLRIENPLYLNVSASGGHRLYAEDSVLSILGCRFRTQGVCYYVQPKEGWYITWKVRLGRPSFVK